MKATPMILIATGLAVAAGVVTIALADDHQGREVRKMLRDGKGAPAIPTGYQVRGETHYAYDAWRGNRRYDPQDTRHPDLFYRGRENGQAGSDAGE